MSSYLPELTVRLAKGISRLPAEVRERHTDYLLQAQRSDGGFCGRAGGASDLYYTSFGLRGLSVLGALYGEPAERAARFLKQQLESRQTIVDFFSLFYAAQLLFLSSGIDVFAEARSDWPDRVARMLSELRRGDGGFAKAAEGHAGSTYHTFLTLLVFELLRRDVPEPDRVLDFLMQQRDPDGGWREIRASKRAGTNPTAAAIACHRMLGELDDLFANQTIDFLLNMQTTEGGLRANTRIPIADLLSSFTGGLTLQDLGAWRELDLPAFRTFVERLQLPSGGFRAAVWDDSHDVEYTFYGLGCLALLNQPEGDSPSGSIG